MFKRSLGQLKADILRANALVQEANFLAEEVGRQTTFSVTLQIPPANLSPNRKVGNGVRARVALSSSVTAFSVRRLSSMGQLNSKLFLLFH
jgi:kinesin family protein 13